MRKRVDLGTPADWVAIGISLVGLLVDLIPSMPKEYVYALPVLALLGLFGVTRIVLRLLRGKPAPEEKPEPTKIIRAEGERSVAGETFDRSTIITGDVGKQEIHYHYVPIAPVQPTVPTPELPPFNPDDPVPPPGPLPACSRIPFPRNDCFTGRKTDLKALADSLIGQGKSAAVGQTAAVIPGLGGLGKTALAVEFAHRYGKFFPGGVFWLHAASDDSISADIADCGLHMGIQPWPDKQPEQVAAVLRTWADGARRLVVLDNVEEASILLKWMAEIRGPALLVTGRRHDWPRELGLAVHRLGLFSPGEARALLRKLAPRLKDAPDVDLDKISERLGHLPLAVDLAGRYLHGRPGLTPQGYLAELAEAESALEHTSLKDWVIAEEVSHAASLAAAFGMSYGRLKPDDATDALAMRLFAAAGYCAPNVPIPRDIFRALAGDDAKADHAVARLADLGLLSPGETGPAIHPLTAEFARRVGSGDALAQMADVLRTLTYQANETGLPQRFVPLRAHVETAARAAEGTDPASAATLWNNLGYHLKMVAEYEVAVQHFRRALAIDEKVYGPDHPEVATDLNNLGLVLQAMGDYSGARDHYERALAIDQKVYGPDNLVVATALNNLGSVLQAMGDLPTARDYHERALRIFEEVLGAEHPNVATLLNNLGLVLYATGDYPRARDHFVQVLAILEKTLPSEHPYVASTLNNLGGVLQAMGDNPRARDHYERALAILEKTLPPGHPHIQDLRMKLEALDKQR